MKNTKMVVNTELGIFDYVNMVEEIADEYFSANGEYTPHIGWLNALRLFYNQCVVKSKFDIPHNIEGALEIEPLVKDKEFVDTFNSAINYEKYDLSFGSAYRDAMDIVNTRKSSFGNAAEIIRNALTNIIDKINPIFDENNIGKLQEIANDIQNGNLSADAIVKAYNDSKSNRATIQEA